MSRHRIVTIVFLLVLLALWLLRDTLHLSLPWIVLIAGAYVIITAYGASSLSMQYFTKTRTAGARSGSNIALTFDDGPVPGKTERILDILKHHEASGTFFCIGSNVQANPDIVRRISSEGHLVGNHS